LSAIPAAIIYLLPFLASAHVGSAYGENGLYLVYRENILRYFQPFDHKDPVYTYFLYLPIYLLPWAVFFIPALGSLKIRWKTMTAESRWMVWSLFLLFLFFTVSGSRRSYYVLPMVPFAILLTADWLSTGGAKLQWAWRFVKLFFVIFLVNFLVLQPLYYAKGGMRGFAEQLKEVLQPGTDWKFVMLDPQSKISFYLQLPPTTKYYGISGTRGQQTLASLQAAWPELKNRPKQVIILSRKQYEPLLTAFLKDYTLISAQPSLGERVFHMADPNLPIAYIPN